MSIFAKNFIEKEYLQTSQFTKKKKKKILLFPSQEKFLHIKIIMTHNTVPYYDSYCTDTYKFVTFEYPLRYYRVTAEILSKEEYAVNV